MTGVRAARPGDAPACQAIAEAAYAPYVAVLGRRPPPMEEDWAAEIAAGRVLVAEAGGAPAGYVIHGAEGADWAIWNLGVDPAAQSGGVGRALMAAAEAAGRAAGAARAILATDAAMSRPLALYPRLGFEEVGREAGPDGRDRVRFAKPLR